MESEGRGFVALDEALLELTIIANKKKDIVFTRLFML